MMQATRRTSYFLYGTLMDRDVLNIVSGLNLSQVRLRPALLPGYRRVRDVHYPAVFPSEAHSVEGCVVHGISEPAAARIGLFEIDGYDLVVEQVVLGNRRSLKAALFAASGRMNLSDEDWSFEDWRNQHRRRFRQSVKSWADKLDHS
jgi:hypothetical protein